MPTDVRTREPARSTGNDQAREEHGSVQAQGNDLQSRPRVPGVKEAVARVLEDPSRRKLSRHANGQNWTLA